MIRCCSKFVSPVSSRYGSSVSLNRVYVLAPSSKENTQRHYASGGGSKGPRRLRKLFYSTIGLTIVGFGGAIVYAKNDPKFRKVLNSYIPGTDGFINFVYQEEGSLNLDLITEQLSSLQEKVVSLPTQIYKQISSGDEASSSSGKESKVDDGQTLAKPKPVPIEEATRIKAVPKEIKIESVPAPVIKPTKPAVGVSKKSPPPVTVSNEPTESNLSTLANDTLKLYNDAIGTIQKSGGEIIDLIDKSVEDIDQKAWNQIKKKLEENQKKLDEVENTVKAAGEKYKQFTSLLKSAKLPQDAADSLKKLEGNVNKAKAKLEDLKNSRVGASSNYFKKIEDARKHFSEELTALFPSVKLSDKQLKLSEQEIDLFLYYAVQKLLYYQKELKKIETLTSQRLKKVIQDSKDASFIQDSIDAEVDKAKREIKDDFDKKVLDLKSDCDQEVHKQLKRQEMVHIDILEDQLKLKEAETQRKMDRVRAKVEVELRSKLEPELAEMTARMKALNEAISKRALQDGKAQASQALWRAAEALYVSLKTTDKEELTPLTEKVDAIKKAAAKGDDLVEAVVATIPSTALKRGVYTEQSLRERFLKVEKVAWRVAIVPEGGASLPFLLVAWLQSVFVIKPSEPIPREELANEPIDPESFNNYDIIQRARYYVDRDDFEQALRYMNLLKGGARSIALEWMKEVTTLLETQQAAKLLLAHASASGMIYS